MTTTRKPFPAGGADWDTLRGQMRAMAADDLDWQGGRTPLFVFRNDQETYEIGKRAFMEFFSENALGRARAFFSIGSMEKDVLEFGLSLFRAPEGATGAFTSGGSESIFLALKAARDRWRAGNPALAAAGRQVNIVMPVTAHPAFDKAADAMDLEIRRGTIHKDKRADPESLRDLIDDHTIALVGSAPCFPHGVVDPIGALSDLALEAGVWLHVDACVGGWIAPFFTMNGRPTPSFDFRYPGVCSISADLHKFGFCPKPASTVFYRDAGDLERARFVADAWPNGRFATDSLVGTRPGGAVAGAWAVLNHLGETGYRAAAKRLAAMIDAYVEGIEAIPGLKMLSRPDLTIINFGSDEVDIYHAALEMRGRGWLPGLTKAPRGMHAMMSMLHDAAREPFLADLREAVEIARIKEPGTSALEAVY